MSNEEEAYRHNRDTVFKRTLNFFVDTIHESGIKSVWIKLSQLMFTFVEKTNKSKINV